MTYSAAHILIHNKQKEFIRIGIHKSEKKAYLPLKSLIILKKCVSYSWGIQIWNSPTFFIKKEMLQIISQHAKTPFKLIFYLMNKGYFPLSRLFWV